MQTHSGSTTRNRGTTRRHGALALAPLVALAAAAPGPFTTALAAQEGTIAYTHTVEVEISEEMRARFEGRGGRGARGGGPGGQGGLPTTRTDEVLVLFNATQSLMKPVPRERREARQGGPGGGGGDRIAGFQRRMRASSANRGDRETLVESYTDFSTGTVVETREFLTRTFRIEDTRPQYQWRLTSEQAEFLGYAVQKATAVHDSTTIEVWFTPEIPVMGGPASFGGLPGMILVVSIDGGKEQYSATEVSMSAVAEDVIVAPEDGDQVTRDEYEEMVAEKLEELRATQRGTRG